MFNKLIMSICAGTMTLFFISACADEAKDSDESLAANPATDITEESGSSLMNQPVDFSSAEAAEETLQNIREKEGDKSYQHVTNAMQFIMVYDLSIRKNKELLYKKLDGMTPEEIIDQAKR